MFAKNCSSASIQYDTLDRIINPTDPYNHLENEETPKFTDIVRAAALSMVLAKHNVSKITNWPDVFTNEDRLLKQIQHLSDDRVKYYQSVVNDHRRAIKLTKLSSKEFAASNEAIINTTLDQTLGNGEVNGDQLDAQIIRHHLTTPMKVIQSLLSLAIAEHQETVDSDSKEINFDEKSKTQIILRIIEQLKYKPRVFKAVLVDFDFLLRQESSKFVSLKRAMDKLTRKVDHVLAIEEIPSVGLLESLSNEWKKLPAVIAKAEPQFFAQNQLLNRMQNLLKCAEFGIAAFQDCRNNPTKLMAFSVHVDKSSERLQRWEQHEKDIYDIVIPALKYIEESTRIRPLILSILPQLDTIFNRWRQLQLYNTDLNRMIENTDQLIRKTISLLNNYEYLSLREMVLSVIEKIGVIHSDDPNRKKLMEILNDDITSNLLVEMCQTTRETLKLRVFPFDQEYLELCDNIISPPFPPKSSFPSRITSADIKKRLLENIELLKYRISTEAGRHRPGADQLFPKYKFPPHRPFYVWKSKKNKYQIQKLLSNKLVTLNADVLDAPKDIAIKFSKIMLDFRFADKSKQNAFYKVLNGMSIKLQMIGNNYYRCERRTFYVKTDADIQFMYQVSINNKNEMDVSGMTPAYQIAMGRKAFLSPYTTWQIQIFGTNEKQNQLKQFINDEIDLELIGIGSVVLRSKDSKNACENVNLRKNYNFRVTLN